MLNQQYQLHLLAEQKFLREQLATLPESAKLTRMSVESLLHSIEEQLRQVPADEQAPLDICDYWWPEKEECMKMTAALVEFGAINYHATMKGQPRSCCGNKIGCYLTREARTIVRQQKSREYKICAYDDIKGTLCGDNSLSTKFNHAVTCEDCLKILKKKEQ